MLKTFYLILVIAFVVSSCSSKNIPVQEIEHENQVKAESTPEKSAIDSAQVIKINNKNRKNTIINTSNSKQKKRMK